MKALLLGCGEMGEEALQDLYHYGAFSSIIVGTRSIDHASRVVKQLKGSDTKISIVQVNAADIENVASLMEGCAVAVNCTGPNYKYELPVARAAIKAGVHLVDINDEYEITLKMFELDEDARKAGVLIVLGLGGCPGIDNVLVRSGANQLDEIEEIHTAWVMSGSDPGGLALSYHLLYSLSGRALTVEHGKLIEVQSFIDGRERMEFPDPIGAVDVFHIGHPEPITLARTFSTATSIDNKATFVPSNVNDLIVRLGKIVRDAPKPVRIDGLAVDVMDFTAAYLHQSCKGMQGVPKEAALRVEVRGKKRGKKRRIFFSSVGRLGRATGIPASIGAIMISRGRMDQRGVLPPEACIEPHDFLYEILNRRNIAKLNGWIEE